MVVGGGCGQTGLHIEKQSFFVAQKVQYFNIYMYDKIFGGGQDFKDSNFNLSYFVPPVLVNLGASEFARPPGNWK